MIDGEWQLDYPGTSIRWGVADTSQPYTIFHAVWPDLGDVPIAAEDFERPRTDGVMFGSDYLGGRTISFSLWVGAPDEASALQAQTLFVRAWNAPNIRKVPGALATLTTRNAGRDRLVYGRPRRLAPSHDVKRKLGVLAIECDFACADHLFYDVTENSEIVPFVPPPTSGFVAPFSFPLSTVGTSTNWSTIVVDGEEPVWPVLIIKGPITNPVVNFTGRPNQLLLPLTSAPDQWSLKLVASIPAGVEITIDTRPWKQSVTRSDGAGFAGALTSDSRIDRASLRPGTYTVTLGGIDGTGTSRLGVNWRHTYGSI